MKKHFLILLIGLTGCTSITNDSLIIEEISSAKDDYGKYRVVLQSSKYKTDEVVLYTDTCYTVGDTLYFSKTSL